MLEVTYEASSGIVTTVSRGLNTPEQFDEHVRKLVMLIEKSRARNGVWLHLIDVADHVVQSSGSTDHMAKAWRTKPDTGGYSAYVTTSSLARLQIKRIGPESRKAFFEDVPAARAWLLEHARHTALAGA